MLIHQSKKSTNTGNTESMTCFFSCILSRVVIDRVLSEAVDNSKVILLSLARIFHPVCWDAQMLVFWIFSQKDAV